MTIDGKRRYVIEVLAGKSKIKRFIYERKVRSMSEGEVLKLYYLLSDRTGAENE